MKILIKGGAALLLFALSATPAFAMFRCGKVIQDRACDAGVPETRLGPSGRTAPSVATAATASSRSDFAATCGQLGEEAQRVTWKREAGATQERQIAELPNNGARDDLVKVVESVYRKRGSAPEIRLAIEAECIADKQKSADAIEVLKALQQQAGQAPAAPSANRAAAAVPVPVPRSQAAPVSAAASGQCAGLRAERDNVNQRLREGGNVATMERLQQSRRQAEKTFADAGC